MKREVFSLQMGDSASLFGRIWRPDTTPTAVICLIHGLGEHAERYAHVADFFNEHGYAIVACDLRGHGKSDGQRGHFKDYDQVMDDISRILDHTKATFPGIPVFLYGHSMGGSFVLNYAIRKHPDVKGLIVTSPGLKTGKPVSKVTMSLGKIMYQLLPTFSLDNGLDTENLSRDTAVVTAYRNDPLVHPKISARFGLDLINSGVWALEHAHEVDLPLLLQVGSGDHIVLPEAVEEFGRKAQHCDVKVWPGLFHETHNEPEQSSVLKVSLDWMNKLL